MFYKIPLILTPQPKGGYTVASPLLQKGNVIWKLYDYLLSLSIGRGCGAEVFGKLICNPF
ncbi:MAG: hypothetical protein AAB116_24345 [Candidatus Poribacteria bacterium]